MAKLPEFRYLPAEDYDVSEFTLIQETLSETLGGAEAKGLRRSRKKDDYSRSDAREIWSKEGERARVLECSCFQRKYLSATVRRIGDGGSAKFPFSEVTDLKSKYLVNPDDPEGGMNSRREIADLLLRLIFGDTHDFSKRADGLVIIAGSTNSWKSTTVRALIHQYLSARLTAIKNEIDGFRKAHAGELPRKVPRRPHLITVEDPIEEKFAEALESLRTWIDYTPRELGLDVMSLQDAIEDALRQTPEVLYVGEVRDHRDWPALLEFARSGHLAVVTTHAGNLTEALRNVFRAAEAKTPAGRSEVAASIKGVVHLRVDGVPDGCLAEAGVRKKMLVPAIWRAQGGAQDLTEYGLSSVLQSHPGVVVDGPIPKEGCLGRKWFAEYLLLKRYCDGDRTRLDQFQELILQAGRWDLRGE